MNLDLDPDDEPRLRAALARAVDGYVPPPAPVDRVLAAGRARKARRRRAAVLAAAACVLAVAGLTVPLAGRGGDGPARPLPSPAVPTPEHVRPPAERPVTVSAGHGALDGTTWSVTVEYYPQLPPSAAADFLSGASAAAGTSLICRRMFIGHVQIDHQAGLWAGCTEVDGARDPRDGGDEGLWGLHDKGTSGTRLFVADPGPGIASGTVTLDDGTALTGQTVTAPGTTYRCWVVAIPDGRTIVSVDQYDARHHLVSRETEWR
ncbi:hypothetical protein [Actinacidiphila acididurans]|uniref:Uncharacterized protein n=1 Tax=Actinacidiphila acididurans TaxID=2784346 RepID=A0ABS2U5T4_9ACTN|nr:hypothetical protein [Actinacidiphila acididurans]MBM9510382.1 hypothetical protein [Actinacidiphila acididurans]